MRTTMKLAIIPALLATVACREKIDGTLASDLALIKASDIELANASGAASLVVSPIENIPAPSPRPMPTPSKVRGKKAPPPIEVAADVAASEPTSTVEEIVTVAESPAPVAADTPAPDAPPVVRPRPIEPRYPIGSGESTVVIRGGRTGRDPCVIHPPRGVDGVLINDRVPRFPTGTFPRY